MKIMYSGNLGVDYGQFYIDVASCDEDDEAEEDYQNFDLAFENQENGLCGASQDGKIFFVAGIQNGVIQIDCELHEIEPPLNNSYDEIVEASLVAGDEPLSLCEWGHEETHLIDLAKGEYRVRYLVRGMDLDYDDENEDESYWESPLEGQSYLVQIWPAGKSKDILHKHTTENARYWHREWGGLDKV